MFTWLRTLNLRMDGKRWKKNYHIQGQLAQDSSQRINFQDGQRSFQHVYLTHTKCNNNFRRCGRNFFLVFTFSLKCKVKTVNYFINQHVSFRVWVIITFLVTIIISIIIIICLVFFTYGSWSRKLLKTLSWRVFYSKNPRLRTYIFSS